MTTAKTNNEFGKKLRSARKRAQMTQGDALEAFKQRGFPISQGALSHYETGRNYPDPDLMAVMADVYGVSLDYLTGLTQTKEPVAELEETLKTATGAGKINRIMDRLSKAKQQQVLDFAEFLFMQENKDAGVPEAFQRWAAATEVVVNRHGASGAESLRKFLVSDHPDLAAALGIFPKKKFMDGSN